MQQAGWLSRTLCSSLGRKYIVALTGLAMVGFLVAHLSGNLLIFAGPEAMTIYAEGLRKFPVILNLLRAGLAVMAIAHVFFAIQLNLENKAARPQAYQVKNYKAASWASRQMVITGLLILFYILYHLAHFTWRITNEEIGALGHYDVYQMLVMSFGDPVQAITYILAMVLTGVHLTHGVSSLFQTLGINHPKYNCCIRKLGPAVGILIAGGFISIPLAVMLGIVK